MKTLMNKMSDAVVGMKENLRNLMNDEKGESHIVAVVLVLVVVVALAAIFKDKITDIVESMLGKTEDTITRF